MKLKINHFVNIYIFIALSCGISCKKLVEIPEPVNSITSSETFGNNANATSAVIGMYSDLILGYNQNFDYGNGATTLYAGLSSDELSFFDNTDFYAMQFQNNG